MNIEFEIDPVTVLSALREQGDVPAETNLDRVIRHPDEYVVRIVHHRKTGRQTLKITELPVGTGN